MTRLFGTWLLILLVTSAGCASTRSASDDDTLPEMPPLPPEEPDEPEPKEQADAAGPGDGDASVNPTDASLQPPAATPPPVALDLPDLPAALDAGEISRSTLYSVLADGIGLFLRRVRTEPHLAGGRFVGWRLLSAPSEDQALRTGDTVLRVNGQTIERPEQFKNVWDSMATSSELVVDVRRGERDGKVRYRIVD